MRPLFRKLLHLGGSDNDSKAGALSNSYGFPANGRKTYKEFGDYELEGQPSGASSNGDKFAAVATQTQIRGGGRSESVSSDSESQKQILSGNHQSVNQGIMVSHQVNITHTEERAF